MPILIDDAERESIVKDLGPENMVRITLLQVLFLIRNLGLGLALKLLNFPLLKGLKFLKRFLICGIFGNFRVKFKERLPVFCFFYKKTLEQRLLALGSLVSYEPDS